MTCECVLQNFIIINSVVATTCQDAVTIAGNEDIFELEGCIHGVKL